MLTSTKQEVNILRAFGTVCSSTVDGFKAFVGGMSCLFAMVVYRGGAESSESGKGR